MRPYRAFALALLLLAPLAIGATPGVDEPLLDPARHGAWDAPASWPVQAEHMALLPSGKVLAFIGQNQAFMFDPATGSFKDVSPGGDTTISCAGHAFLGDGRLLVNGGSGPLFAGHKVSYVFDPILEAFVSVPDMNEARYYPSTLTLADGTALSLSGNTQDGKPALSAERFDGADWSTLAGADREMDMYPRVHLLPSGQIVRVSQEQQTLFLDPATGTWTEGPASIHGQRWGGVSALLPGLDSVLVVGGGSIGADGEGQQTAMALRDDLDGVLENTVDGLVQGGSAATATAEILDVSGPAPVWRETQSMLIPRRDFSGVLLADGSYMVVGGGAGAEPLIAWDEYALNPEIFDPATESWSLMAPSERHRGYHSTAILLPDARVLVAGGDFETGTGPNGLPLQQTAEVFSPPYLFQGPRPTIAKAPATLDYERDAFLVETPDVATIDHVALVRLSSVTHSLNTDQRYVELDFEEHGGRLLVHTGFTPNEAPPGPYMLFVLQDGVPSIASMLLLS